MNTNSAWLDPELEIFREQVARVLQREFAPHVERWQREGVVDRDSWLRAGARGLLCTSIPAEFGGGGGTLAHDAVIAQELVRSGVGSSMAIGVHSAICARYILHYGSESQKLRWLPRMARGEIVAAIAMTEPAGGSDLRAVRTTARRVDGGYRINGQKTFISNGQNADLVITVCRNQVDADSGANGISLLMVEPADCTGFRRGRNLQKIGMHGQDTSELFYEDAFVPHENLLGAAGQGFDHLKQQLGWERLYIALGATASMERAVELAVDYTKSREVFGRKLFDYQNTQFKLAECRTRALIARRFVDDLMVKLLRDALDPTEAAMAKLWCTDTQSQVIDECLQLFGGYGYMAEYPISHMWADSRVTRIFGGSNEIMKVIIARSL